MPTNMPAASIGQSNNMFLHQSASINAKNHEGEYFATINNGTLFLGPIVKPSSQLPTRFRTTMMKCDSTISKKSVWEQKILECRYKCVHEMLQKITHIPYLFVPLHSLTLLTLYFYSTDEHPLSQKIK